MALAIETRKTQQEENHHAGQYDGISIATNKTEIIESMIKLVRESDAACNHPVHAAVEWMVVAHHHQAETRTTARWSVPLERVVKDPDELFRVHANDDDIHLSLCRRDCCVAGGECLDETFTIIATNYTAQRDDPPLKCETRQDVSNFLSRGAWERNSQGNEEWVSPACFMPTTIQLPPPSSSSSSAGQERRVLFIGDSTLQEIALMVAHGVGSSRNMLGSNDNNDNNLNCSCQTAYTPGTTKDCRIFDATSPFLNVSMIWAGHAQCEGNRMGVNVVDDFNWRTRVVSKVQTLQPDVIFFQVPISHSCTDIDSCSDALERYICFLTQLLPSQTQTVLMITGSALSRAPCKGATGRHCPSHLRNWISKIQDSMLTLAPHVPILNIFGPTEGWLDLTSPSDPFTPGCRGMERHLTCDFTGIDLQIALNSPFYIVPPGRLAGAAVIQMISITSEDASTAAVLETNNDTCNTRTFIDR